MSQTIDFVIENGELVKYNGTEAKVIIPYGVKSIGHVAFAWCESITSIVIPENITSVGALVFYGCKNLQAINCEAAQRPHGWNGDWAMGCNAKVAWGYEMTAADEKMGYKTKRPVQEEEPASPRSDFEFKKNFFNKTCVLVKYKGSAKSVVIPGDVTSIGEKAFAGCSTLRSISIPASVKTIGNNAFANCSALTSVSIADGLTTIEYGAFYNCTALQRVILPNTVTVMGNSVFEECVSLTETALSDSLTSIDIQTFYGCSSLASIYIPDSVTCINDKAFAGCEKLETVYIPASVAYAGEYIFANCKSLESINCAVVRRPTGWDNGWNYKELRSTYYRHAVNYGYRD